MLEMNQVPTNTPLLPWHVEVWKKTTARFPNLGHAFLLHGKQGSGKQQFALQFSKWLLCQDKQSQGGCGHCSSCAWVQAGTHPQMKIIQPEWDEKKQSYGAIKIDQIRQLNEFVQQTVAGWRIIVIYPAEQLNIAASNALLKTLEEPGERVLLLMVSDAMLKLSATIRSRVQQIALDRMQSTEAMAYLETLSTSYSVQERQIALALAAEMPLKAQTILQSPWFAQREQFLHAWLALVQYKNQPMKFSVGWLKQLDFKSVMLMLRYILQDLVAFKLQQTVKQSDLDISALAHYYSLEQLFAIYTQINKMNQMLMQNVQTQLIFDELTMRLMNVEQT